MARIRSIKPEFWSSPSMRGADPWARLLYIAMWNWADDSGRGTANVRELAAFAFPDEEDPVAPTASELPSLLAEVRGRWGVIFYEVRGRRYYAIPSWDTHQRNERRAASRHPGPDEGTEYDPNPPDLRKPADSRKCTEVPTHNGGSSAQPHGSSGPGTGEQGNRGTGELGEQGNRGTGENTPPLAALAAPAPLPRPPRKPTANTPRLVDDDGGFAEFYAAYPRRVDRRAAERAWAAARKRGVPADRMISAARRYAASVADAEPRYVKHPASWLNAGAYDDEPAPVPARPPSRAEGWQQLKHQPPRPDAIDAEVVTRRALP